MIVVGIDPGTRCLGFGILRVEKAQGETLGYGILNINTKQPFPKRLLQIHEKIQALVLQYHPDVIAVEEAFVYKNAKTALALGHARGAVLLAAALKNIEVAEYAPRDIKKAVTGNGAASKQQVQWMVAQMLHVPTHDLAEDAADGLAVALCHAMRHQENSPVQQGKQA